MEAINKITNEKLKLDISHTRSKYNSLIEVDIYYIIDTYTHTYIYVIYMFT